MTNKIKIGTAQFGGLYGISNSDRPNDKEINKIFSYCKQLGVYSFDTAKNYGNSESVLGKYINDQFCITTKIQKYDGEQKIEDYVISNVKDSLSKLQINKLYAVLLHHPSDLYKYPKILDVLNKLKNDGLIDKIGFSVYSPNELNKLLNNFDCDIIQCPTNIFDRRFLNSGIFADLKKKNIEIEIRSIFLQGLLFMNSNQRPNYFNKWNHILLSWEAFLKENNSSPLELAIDFVKKIDIVDRFVFGINSLSHLSQIVDTINQDYKKCNFQFDFSLQDLDGLILPSLWEK